MLTFIALGANLGDDPVSQLEEAIRRLHSVPGISSVIRAPIYRSKPIGPPGQPDYANTVVSVETDLPPIDLLDALQSIEAAMGRTRGARWGPRLIDLDLLLYGSDAIDHPRLSVPHPEMIRRRFVLQPLADLSPDLVIPGTGASVGEHLARLSDPDDLVRVS